MTFYYLMKRKLSFFIIFLIAFSFAPAAFSENVAVVLTKGLPVFDSIYENFVSKLKSAQPDATVKKIIVNEENLNATKAELTTFAPKVIFSVGTKASYLAKQIPGAQKIFTMVVNPIGDNFCSKDGNPLDDMTGVLISVSPEMQFNLLKRIMPNGAKIGVVYDPSKSSLTVNAGLKVADKMGLFVGNIPVTDPAQVPDKIEGLKGKIDVLWGVVDDTVYNKNSMEFILLFSFRNKIPLIGFSENQVKAGALFAMFCNYPVLGTQAADLAVELLKGKTAKDLPLQDPQDVSYALNSTSAKLMGLSFPADVAAKATKVYE
jgi:putative tryptophan/tyrosine transport system substrate-binding protein